jgi:hypothetical protein
MVRALAAVAVTLTIAVTGVSAQAPADRVPVVVELFTSEGCSSCPPADALLSRLAAEQPVAGAWIIPLGMHVTYWDRLGWKDPASLPAATARQQDYGRVFGEDRVYTPQAVVDGREEVVGSSAAGVTRAVAAAAKRPHARVSLAASLTPAGTIVARVDVADVPSEVKETLRTLVLVTEDGLSSVVTRGENGGRTLRHDAVVRRVSSTVEIAGVEQAWRRDRLRVVAIVQGERTQRIFGAASASIRSMPPPENRR